MLKKMPPQRAERISADKMQAVDQLSHETIKAIGTALDATLSASDATITDEVRQLALRTAEVAKITHDLIKTSTSVQYDDDKVIELSSLLEQSKQSFSSISTSPKKPARNFQRIDQAVTRIEQILNDGIAA